MSQWAASISSKSLTVGPTQPAARRCGVPCQASAFWTTGGDLGRIGPDWLEPGGPAGRESARP
eukprot:13889840-Alexandrium_andersonii.AAC.1